MQVILVKFRLQRSPKFNIVVASLNSTQQPGHIFLTSFSPRNFVQMASDKSFNYQNDDIEDSEVDNSLKR